MTTPEALLRRGAIFKGKKLHLALYRMHWYAKNGGGTSLASVYMAENGDFWFAPTNWIHPAKLSEHISDIKKMELIAKND